MFKKLPPALLILFNVVALCSAFPATAQQRPLVAADFGKSIPQFDKSLLTLKGNDVTKKLLLAPYDGTALRLALSNTSTDFLNGTSVEDIIAELSAIHVESMEQILPAIIAPLTERHTISMRTRSPGARLHQPLQLAAAGGLTSLGLFAIIQNNISYFLNYPTSTQRREFANDNFGLSCVNEYEYVINGMTANVREELTFSIDKKYVKFRHLKRETVEKNDDPTAVGKYVVERGTLGSGPGENNVQSLHPRRLRPTSTHRTTTETIREATVERCPDAQGISGGVTLNSITIRVTASASGNGSPTFIECVAQGIAKGQVNDAATLTSFDWEVKSQSRFEALNMGQNFGLSQSMQLSSIKGSSGGDPVVTVSDLAVTGVGSTEEARNILSVQENIMSDAFVPLLDGYDKAETEWRSGRCIELVVASGAEPRKLTPVEARKLVVEARHSNEPPPIAVPVTGTPWGGTITNPDNTPSATFTYKSGSKDESSGGVTFKSVSRRGIAKDIQVDFHMGKVPVKVELSYFENETQTVKRATLPGIDVEGGDETQATNAAHTSIFYHFPSASNLKKGHIVYADDDNPEAGSKTEFIRDDGYYEYKKTETDATIKAKVGNQTVVQNTEKGNHVSFQAFSNPKYHSSVMFTKATANEPAMFVWNVLYPAYQDGEEFTVGNGMSITKGEEGVEWIEKKITDPNSPYKTEYLIKVKLNAAEELKKGNKGMKDLFGVNTDELITVIDPTKPKKDMVTATGSRSISIRILSPYSEK